MCQDDPDATTVPPKTQAFKGLNSKGEQHHHEHRIAPRLASLALLGCLQLFHATPLAWAAASLVPGYHLARAGLHLMLAHDQDGQVGDHNRLLAIE